MPRLLWVMALTSLVGCQSQPVWSRPGPPTAEYGGARPRSIVLDSPALQRLAEGDDEADLPWYADRRDHPLSTSAGYVGPTVQSTFTRSIDRRHESRGRVYDTSTETTYRTRVRETVY